jgi:hypothetical protein
LFIGILSVLPYVSYGNFCCCLWFVCGGFLAVYLHQQSDPTAITVGRGAITGLLSGIVGAVVYLIAIVAISAVFAPLEELADAMGRSAADMPPEVRRVFDWFMANPILLLVVDFFMRLVVGTIFSTIGGVIGAVFLRNDVPPALGGPIQPPPLPPQ